MSLGGRRGAEVSRLARAAALLLAACSNGSRSSDSGTGGLGVQPATSPSVSRAGSLPSHPAEPMGPIASVAQICPADHPISCGPSCCVAPYVCRAGDGGCALPAEYSVSCSYVNMAFQTVRYLCLGDQSCVSAKNLGDCSRLSSPTDGGEACADGGYCPLGSSCDDQAGACVGQLNGAGGTGPVCPAGTGNSCGVDGCCPTNAACGATGCGCGASAPMPCGAGCCPAGETCDGSGRCVSTSCPLDHPQLCGTTCCLDGASCDPNGSTCGCTAAMPVGCGELCCEDGAFCATPRGATTQGCFRCPVDHPLQCGFEECCANGDSCDQCPGSDGPHCRDTPCPCPSGSTWDHSRQSCVGPAGAGGSGGGQCQPPDVWQQACNRCCNSAWNCCISTLSGQLDCVQPNWCQ